MTSPETVEGATETLSPEEPSITDEAIANAEAQRKKQEVEIERKSRALAEKSLTRSEIAPLVPTDYKSMVEMASVITESGLLPKSLADQKNPKAAAFAAIQMGLEVGLPPMQAIQTIAVINGKPVIYGDGQMAIVENSGKLEYISEFFEGTEFEDDFTAICITKRVGQEKENLPSKFSVLDAKRAKLWSPEETVTRYKKGGDSSWQAENTAPWHKYPKRMLMYRARAFNLRDNFADCLLGLQHSAEEMEDVAEMKDITEEVNEAGQLDQFEKDFGEGIIDGNDSDNNTSDS